MDTTSDQPNAADVDVDVAVIGGGLAGLTAAALAARGGATVALIERGDLGGRARTVERDDYWLNDGPHALYQAGAAVRVFADLGIVPTGGQPELRNAELVADGNRHRLPLSAGALLRSGALSVRGKLAAAKVMPAILNGSDDAADGLSLAAWFERRNVPADLRRLIEMYIRLSTYCNAPDTLDAVAAISQFGLSQSGVLYVHGGWQRLVDALRAAATGHGASITTGAVVTSLRSVADRWELTSDEARWTADSVVIAAGGPAVAERLTGAAVGWVDRAGPPVRSSCLDLGTRRPVEVPLLLSMDEPLYGSAHAPTADLAPSGAGLVSVIRYLAPGEAPDRDQTRHALVCHAERMGVASDDVVVDRYLHEMTVTHGMPLANRRRPTGDELAAEGLWVAGDWVDANRDGDPVPLLADAAVSSAAVAAAGALRRTKR